MHVCAASTSHPDTCLSTEEPCLKPSFQVDLVFVQGDAAVKCTITFIFC